MSALIAYVHSLSMIGLGTMLYVLVTSFDKLQVREGVLGFVRCAQGAALAALIMLASGVILVWLSAQGVSFYLRNPVFWIKVALFAAMLLIAITPARIILHWDRQIDLGNLPDAATVAFLRRYVMVEAVIYLLLPLAAALAARGIGLQVGPG